MRTSLTAGPPHNSEVGTQTKLRRQILQRKTNNHPNSISILLSTSTLRGKAVLRLPRLVQQCTTESAILSVKRLSAIKLLLHLDRYQTLRATSLPVLCEHQPNWTTSPCYKHLIKIVHATRRCSS